MYRTLAVLALLAGLALPVAAAGQTLTPSPVALRPSVTVDGEVVRLGDLFSGLGAAGDTPVARAPEPGGRVELPARWLARLAVAYDVDWQPRSGMDRSVVERRARVLDADDIVARLADAFRAAGETGDLDITLDNSGIVVQLPTDENAVARVIGLSRNPRSGRFRATLIYPDQGTPRLRVSLAGQAVEMIEVPVLIRRVAADETIGRGDVAWVEMRADRVGYDTVTHPEQLLGKSPRRTLAADRPLRAGDLREPRLIEKNGLVLIRLRTPTMQITVQGRALEDGAAGQAIRIMNTKSNTVINAVVVDTGTVEVPSAARALAAN